MTKLDDALYYASRGWRVISVFEIGKNGRCTCKRREKCSRPGKHPRTQHGVKDASVDPQQIKDWWQKFPNANIGVATGKISGILVIDGDRQNGGAKTLKAKQKQLGTLPKTITAETGGNGRHFIFRYPKCDVKTDTAGLLLGVGLDVLSGGAYFIAPRSKHKSGRRYEWREDHGPRDLEPAELPKAWLDQLGGQHEQSVSVETTSTISQGGRNQHLTSVAGRLRRSGLTGEAILTALLAENSTRCSPPLPKEEVERIARERCELCARTFDFGRTQQKTLPLSCWAVSSPGASTCSSDPTVGSGHILASFGMPSPRRGSKVRFSKPLSLTSCRLPQILHHC